MKKKIVYLFLLTLIMAIGAMKISEFFIIRQVSVDVWDFLAEGDYVVIDVDTSDPILGNWMDEDKYAEVTGFSYGRGAGRYDDYALFREALNEFYEVTTLSQLVAGLNPDYSEFDVPVRSGRGTDHVAAIAVVPTPEGNEVMIPKERELVTDPLIVVMPNREGTYILDNRISQIELETQDVREIIQDRDSNNQIIEAIPSRYENKILLRSFVYEEECVTGQTIHLFDGKNEIELPLAEGLERGRICGWLSDREVVYWVQKDGAESYVVYDIAECQEYILDIDPQMDILGVSNGMIAFSETSGNGSELFVNLFRQVEGNFIVQFASHIGKGETDIVFKHKLKDNLPVYNPKGFSDDGRFYVMMYMKIQPRPLTNIMIFDLEKKTVTDLSRYPDRCGDCPFVDDFFWLDHETLLLRVPADRIYIGNGLTQYEHGGGFPQKVTLWQVTMK